MQPPEMESAPGVEALREGKPPRAGRRVRLGALGAVAAMCLVVALFAVVMHRPNLGTLGVNPHGPAAQADWQTYRDPLGLFSVRLPKEWTAQVSTGEESYGDRTGSATETAETIQFSDPALGAGSAGFDVDASPIQSEFERHWYCQGFTQKQSAFHGIPAEHLSDATWLFDTANAHFQLDVWIPGILEPAHSQPLQLTPIPTATPLPPATVATDRSVLDTILGAFQPTNATALSCP
jgi:hypothetical protein